MTNEQKPATRKAERRAAAELRRREKPLRDEVTRLEARIEKATGALKALEARLADPETYNHLPPDELDGLLREAARLRASRERLEAEWLEASDALDNVRADRG